jgi:hypothetical protein
MGSFFDDPFRAAIFLLLGRIIILIRLAAPF